MNDPALNMTSDDLRFVALIDRRLDDAARDRERLPEVVDLGRRKPCPGCVDPCDQCGGDELD